jgi:hypothetical protein
MELHLHKYPNMGIDNKIVHYIFEANQLLKLMKNITLIALGIACVLLSFSDVKAQIKDSTEVLIASPNQNPQAEKNIEETSEEPTDTALEKITEKINQLDSTLKKLSAILEKDENEKVTVAKITRSKNDTLKVYHKTSVKRLNSKTLKKKHKLLKAAKDSNLTQLANDLEKIEDKYYCKDTNIYLNFVVSSARVIAREGVVTDIQVSGKIAKKDLFKYESGSRDSIECIFENSSSPIDIMNSQRDDKLFCTINGKKLTLYYKSAFSVERSAESRPDDFNTQFDAPGTSYSAKKGTGLNGFLNVKLYSDLLGSVGGESNGLVSTEVSFKTPIHFKNIPNKSCYLGHFLKGDVAVSRFDSKFQSTSSSFSTDSLGVGLDTSLSRIDLHQRRWFTLNLELNIWDDIISTKSNNRNEINLVTGIGASRLKTTKDSGSVILPYIGIKYALTLRPIDNFNIEVAVPIVWQRVPSLEDYDLNGNRFVFSPTLELMWNPYNNPGDKIYCRARYNYMTKESSPYLEFQLGYALSISELIKDKSPTGTLD